jgi:Spy/CpxP family protein refolding chaperone
MHVLHELKLSDAQHQQVKAILEQARAERQAAAPPAAADQLALADPGDPNHAAAVATAKLRAADHIQHLSDVQQQLYAVLTPAQQAQLPTLLAAQQKHWAEHWAGHGEPRQ